MFAKILIDDRNKILIEKFSLQKKKDECGT